MAIELPLFPLNTVLFPGMPLQLHIFEDRYKQMVRLCLDEKRPFGVTLIRNEQLDTSRQAEPHVVGCTARIARVQPLAEERLFIISVGQERFRTLRLVHDQAYLMGVVELEPLQWASRTASARAVERLMPLLSSYLEVMARAGKVEFEADQIPNDPEELAYLAAAVITLAPEDKQALLEVKEGEQLLRRLSLVYRRELPIMRGLPATDQGIFSLN